MQMVPCLLVCVSVSVSVTATKDHDKQLRVAQALCEPNLLDIIKTVIVSHLCYSSPSFLPFSLYDLETMKKKLFLYVDIHISVILNCLDFVIS